MGIYNEKLWELLKEKAEDEDKGKPEELKCEHDYLAAIKGICNYAVDLAKTIRDVFPLYTLHDEVHICNVMRQMVNLLGDAVENLSRDETAMLILAACCHDIGMSCSGEQAQNLLEDRDRLKQYLNNNPDAYVRVHDLEDFSKLSDDLFRDFLRTIHHERANDILQSMEWPAVLSGHVDRQDLIQVCQSHGEDANAILKLDTSYGVDLCMCAILLRLADILDFDTSRAPQAIYFYSGFDSKEDSASRFSKDEWQKHSASHGFFFDQVKDRAFPYELPYHATCRSMQIEQAVNSHLDWVDQEFAACRDMLRYCADDWRKLVLPQKVYREIKPEGYLSGQFCFTLDQDKILELFVGKNLYQDPGVFVRELLQNAIDAVRTRKQLDRNLPRNWTPQINIRCWMDEEGYHWFRIEDNGTGMNEEIIEKYFLKVGHSYYASSDFQRDKYRYQADEGYTPISRFGIGILSCFMGDKRTNQVEISTKHFSEDSKAIRMSMQGTSGYYYLANRTACPNPAPMKGVLPEEKRAYRSEAGTAIAVRCNLFQSGNYHSFREILNKYVVFPFVPVHFEDKEGSFDYPTEQELMGAVHAVNPPDDPNQRGVFEFTITDAQVQKIEEDNPGLNFLEKPGVALKCIALDQLTESKYLSGVVLLVEKIHGKIEAETGALHYDTYIKKINSSLYLLFNFYDPDFYSERKLPDSFTIHLCNLKALPWYKKYFTMHEGDEGLISSVAHNGVLCGNAEFFLKTMYNYTHDIILLLKDGYRPEVDIARTRVRQIPLDVAIELEIIFTELQKQGFYVAHWSSELDLSGWYFMIPQATYCRLLENRPDFLSKLYFETNQGTFDAVNILHELHEFGELELERKPFISRSSLDPTRSSTRCHLYEYFCMAYLRREFMLEGKIDSKNSTIFIHPNPISNHEPYTDDFPPTFFLPVKGDTQWISCSNSDERCFCNANHPLSKFIIDQHNILKELVPGLYQELMLSLASDDRDEMIPKVNECLKRIQSLPHGKISVPGDAFLSEKDFPPR